MAASALSTPSSFRASSLSPFSHRYSVRPALPPVPRRYGLSGKALKIERKDSRVLTNSSCGAIQAAYMIPPMMPAVMTPGGPLDLSTVLFRNRIIFIGQEINSHVSQRVISQLMTLAAIDENADILIYINSPAGRLYDVMAIYDCMFWIKPKVGTVCFGAAASEAALLLAGGEKGMRYSMPNSRIMIYQPHGSCEGRLDAARANVDEALHSRNKIDKLYSEFSGQPVERIQLYTENMSYLSPAEAMDFGLIDGLLETKY